MNVEVQPPFLSLLKQIADGVTIYEPFTRTSEKLREFEDTVARLREMERLGLIGKLFIQTRTSSGEESVEMVMVTGGITEEGKRLLVQHNSGGVERSDGGGDLG
jgi:hypothetical protein